MSADMIWTTVAFILTLVVILAYFLGERNPVFNVISNLFIGIAAGYAALVVIFQVIYPRLIVPVMFPSLGYSRALALVPLLLGFLLLFKSFPRLSKIGNLATGLIVGAAAGVIIGGAVLGTLYAQSKAAISLFDPVTGIQSGKLVDSIFMLIGTIATLAYFQFGGIRRPGKVIERPKATRFLANLGKFFIAVTLGALFAGVISATMAVLAERLSFLVMVVQLWMR
ncbi:hypothetical protein hrd7_20020 [Leptolinea sp. HRD-7]|nr:hypothetical protein hrd7_20020 [Leptolinea sp. HRD-7]